MSALPWIAAAVGGGALYLWWKSRKTQSPQQGGGGVCASLCQAAAGQGIPLDTCISACGGIGNVLGAVNPFHNSVDDLQNERDRREANNQKLNGPPDASYKPYSSGPFFPLTTSTLRHVNGCEPYFDAPGWSKCAAGTLDMYASAVAADAGRQDLGITEASLTTPDVFVSLETMKSYLDTTGTLPQHKIDKNAFMTGGAGDPTTTGTYPGAIQEWWTVIGRNVTCPVGQAPRAIMLQQYGLPPTTEDSARECVSTFQNPAVVSQGGGCADGMPTIAGVTWDPATSSWRRLQPGEAVNPGPCAQATPISVSDVTSHVVDTRGAV